MTQATPHRLAEIPSDWQGTAEEAARVLTAVLGEEIQPRTLRDYVSRAIVDRPKRGREGGFQRKQLIQALAARLLVHEGWPVAKIPKILDSMTADQMEEKIKEVPRGDNVDDEAVATAANLRIRSEARKTERAESMRDHRGMLEELLAADRAQTKPKLNKDNETWVRVYHPHPKVRLEIEYTEKHLDKKEVQKISYDIRRYLKRHLERGGGYDEQK